MSKKFSLQLFGHLRTYETCFPYLKKHLLDLADFDVFIHTWSELERKTFSHFDSKIESAEVTKEIKENVIRMYNPKKIAFTDQTKFYDSDTTINGRPRSLNGIRNMYDTIAQSTKLRQAYEQETGSEYELTIITRPDILLREPFPLKMVTEKLNTKRYQNCIFSAPHIKEDALLAEPCVFDEKAKAGDVLFMGKPEIADVFSEMSSSDEFYFLEDGDTNWGEPQFSNFLNQNKVNYKFITYHSPKHWKIQRTDEYSKDIKTDFNRELKTAKKHLKAAFRSLRK